MKEALVCGMGLAVVARENPSGNALLCGDAWLSFDELNARANRLARGFRGFGLEPGDGIALLCSNRAEFAVAMYGALRSGLRITPINKHLTAPEVAYIVENCEARALLADVAHAEVATAARRAAPGVGCCLAIGGAIPGFESFDAALAGESGDDLPDPVLGVQMLYTSGTTGRPKGVHRTPQASLRRTAAARVARAIQYRPGSDLHLCTGPLYHAAPLAFSLLAPIAYGCGVVLMERFDAEEALAAIERHRISHTHLVPIMFHRLLALPEAVRQRYDLSSLRAVIHGAAPCSVELKRSTIEWLGPVLYEYYAGTEGWGSLISSEEWLAHPGSVGRPEPSQVQVRDEDGNEPPPGEPGLLYLRQPEDGGFDYYRDPEKTARSCRDGYVSLGDIGYFDAEGYLYLCDRSADVIITGGVNVYPAEIDAVLQAHPAVRDAASFGIPDSEWGESVLSAVELAPGQVPDEALREALLAHCRKQLAGYKCPRRIEFADSLPRHDTGKILRRLLRDRYWQGSERRI